VRVDDPVDLATIAILGIAGLGLAGAAMFGAIRRSPGGGLSPRTAMARAGSYAGLAVALVVAGRLGVPGVAAFVAVIAGIGLVEWARLFDLPWHHRVSMLVALGVLVVGVAIRGFEVADWLVGASVLVGLAWPVIRVDTGRAIHDLGLVAVGFLLIPVLLAHGLALSAELGEPGIALFAALAVACAGSDVGAFVVGRRFGRTPLSPRLSPAKTRAGLVGNVLGAAIALAAFIPALVPAFGLPFLVGLIPIVAAGSVWGDLLESAVKREAGVKDSAAWLPGFGGILDRIDSLLITVALAYWANRLLGVVAA
jgi:phosphatidate cytidylyltransferase